LFPFLRSVYVHGIRNEFSRYGLGNGYRSTGSGTSIMQNVATFLWQENKITFQCGALGGFFNNPQFVFFSFRWGSTISPGGQTPPTPLTNPALFYIPRCWHVLTLLWRPVTKRRGWRDESSCVGGLTSLWPVRWLVISLISLSTVYCYILSYGRRRCRLFIRQRSMISELVGGARSRILALHSQSQTRAESWQSLHAPLIWIAIGSVIRSHTFISIIKYVKIREFSPKRTCRRIYGTTMIKWYLEV